MGGFASKPIHEKWGEVRSWKDQETPWSDFQVEYVKRVHNSKKKNLRPSGEATNEHAVVRSRILGKDRKKLYERLAREVSGRRNKK